MSIPLRSSSQRWQRVSSVIPKAQAEQVRLRAVGRVGQRLRIIPAALMAQVDEALRLHLAL